MRVFRPVVLAGLAAVALGGMGGLAMADSPDTHVMNVRLPDGTVEQITYTGAVAPQVVLMPVGMPSPFAMIDQVAAMMDRQMAAMMRTGPIPVAQAGGTMCMRSIQVTFTGNGAQPHVVSQTSGNCGGEAAAPTAAPVAPVPVPAQRVIEARNDLPARAGMVTPVADWSAR